MFAIWKKKKHLFYKLIFFTKFLCFYHKKNIEFLYHLMAVRLLFNLSSADFSLYNKCDTIWLTDQVIKWFFFFYFYLVFVFSIFFCCLCFCSIIDTCLQILFYIQVLFFGSIFFFFHSKDNLFLSNFIFGIINIYCGKSTFNKIKIYLLNVYYKNRCDNLAIQYMET